MGWIPLHVHSEYSTLDGAIKIKDYVDWAKKNGLPAIAVTDHGFLSAIPKFDKYAKAERSVKPIFGMEAYVEPVTGTGQKYHHLVILARNQRGLSNLYRLSSMSFGNMKGRFGIIKPEWLKEYGEGLIFLSACMQGELPYLLRRGDEEGALKFVDFMKGFDFFVELVDIGTKEQDDLNRKLKDMADRCGLMTVATPDAHYFAKDRWWYPTFWASNRHTSEGYEDRVADMARMDLSLPSPQYMLEKYGPAAENTALVANMVEDVRVSFPAHMMPKLSSSVDLKSLAERGLEEKIERYGLPKEEYRERLARELDIIGKLGFDDYMLLVHDIIETARKKDIYVGPGRGSAAGSLVAWAIGITAVDPIRHGLIFERFINPGRKDFPDIDVDVEHTRREEVIEDLKNKYGHNAIAGIITFSQYRLRNAVGDVLRAMFDRVKSGSDVEQFKKIVGEEIKTKAEEETKAGEDREYINEEAVYARTKDIMPREKAEEILETAKKIVSLHKNLGRHAAGIVITPGNVEDFCPTACVKSGKEYVRITQFDMSGIEAVKLIKMDILGLKNLTAVREAYETARKFDKDVERPEDIYDYLNGANNLPEDRVRRMWAVITRHPDGVFQLSSWKAKQIAGKIKPKNVSELCDILALNRPGPLANKLDEFYVQKNIPPELDLPALKEITRSTGYVLIYQEQIIETARKVAGFPLPKADDLRKAVGKKKQKEMEELKQEFVKGATSKGYTKEQAETIFSTIEKFAGYAFNKSHSMAYSYLACVTAWQKANYPPVWAKAFLNMKREKDKKEDLGDQIDIANEFCPIYGPQATRKDKTLGDLMEMRVVRQAGIDVSEKDSFLLKNSWALFLGLEDIYQVRKQVRKFSDFPLPESLKQLWELAVKHGMTKSILAPLFSLGVFDRALEGYGDPYLLRAVMMTDEEIGEELREAVKAVMPRSKKPPEERLVGHFPFLSLLITAVEAKRYDEAIDRVAEMYARRADEDRFFEDVDYRNRCISAIYNTERQLLGEGLTVKWWDMAAEAVKYRFACFADHVYALTKSRDRGVQQMIRQGFWTIGKADKKYGRVKLLGRNGAAGFPVIFFADEGREQGVWAVKLKYDGRYFKCADCIRIEPGKTYETDSDLCYKDDRMPERLKEYVGRINPGRRALKIS